MKITSVLYTDIKPDLKWFHRPISLCQLKGEITRKPLFCFAKHFPPTRAVKRSGDNYAQVRFIHDIVSTFKQNTSPVILRQKVLSI